MSHFDRRYQFIIGEAVPVALTPLYLADDGKVYAISQLSPLQVRRYVGLSKTAMPYDAQVPRSVNVYRDDELIPVDGLDVGLEYHLGLSGPTLISNLSPVAWSMRIGSARSSSRLLYRRGDAQLVAQLQAEAIRWEHFTAIADQRRFNLSASPWAVLFVLYDGAVLAPGTGLFNWVTGSSHVDLTFDAVENVPVSFAIR